MDKNSGKDSKWVQPSKVSPWLNIENWLEIFYTVDKEHIWNFSIIPDWDNLTFRNSLIYKCYVDWAVGWKWYSRHWHTILVDGWENHDLCCQNKLTNYLITPYCLHSNKLWMSSYSRGYILYSLFLVYLSLLTLKASVRVVKILYDVSYI